MEEIPPTRCTCYKCVGQVTEECEYGTTVVNNMLYHTFLSPCNECGRPRTEYRDLGTKGLYACWWCRKRAADPPKP